MIHFTERPTRPVWTECARCPAQVRSPRPGGMCRSCRLVVQFEETCARHGIDIASLADDEYVAKRRGENREWIYYVVKDEQVAA